MGRPHDDQLPQVIVLYRNPAAPDGEVVRRPGLRLYYGLWVPGLPAVQVLPDHLAEVAEQLYLAVLEQAVARARRDGGEAATLAAMLDAAGPPLSEAEGRRPEPLEPDDDSRTGDD